MSKILTVEYPDMLPDSLHMSQDEFEHEARLSMAVKLFEMGKLSSGQAAKLAGIPRVHFLYELGRFGVSSVQVCRRPAAATSARSRGFRIVRAPPSARARCD